MTPWQVLHARGVARPVPGHTGPGRAGYHVHYGPGVLVNYSSKMVSVSRQKVTLQELNRRLDVYVKQVERLEAANQKLEQQIQESLSKKCPSKLRVLDTHLRTVSVLQSQINECHSAQAEVKLHLINAQLDAMDLSIRCDQEQEQRELLEAELSDLRLMEAELNVHVLPDLHSVITAGSEELMQLQKQHQQDVQGLMTQLFGGVTVEMQKVTPSQATQQLEDVTPRGGWFHAQVSMPTSAEAASPDLSGSEVIQEELHELWRTAATLEAELRQLQAHNVLLENTELEVRQAFELKLDSLEQTADSLCTELDSVLQTMDQQDLDSANSQLQAEIQDYRTLLEQLSNGVSRLILSSTADAASLCPPLRQKVTRDKTFIVQGGNVTMWTNQSISGPIGPVPPAAGGTPLPESQTTVKSNLVCSRQADNSLTTTDTSKRTDSIHKSPENQKLDEVKEGESVRVSVTAGEWSSSVGDKVKNRECDRNNSSLGETHFSPDFSKEAVIKPCQLEINTPTGLTRLDIVHSAGAESTKPTTATTATKTTSTDSEAPPVMKLSFTPETFSSKQDGAEDDFQVIESGTTIKSLMEDGLPGTEPELKDDTRFVQNILSTKNVEVTDQEPGEDSTSDEGTKVTDVGILIDEGGKVEYQEGEGQRKMEEKEVADEDASLVLRPEYSLSLLNIKDKTAVEDTTTVTETTSTDSDLPNTMKLESISSTQTILENDSQADDTERNITPLITESFPGTEAKLTHETQFTPMTCSINTNVNADTTQGLVDTDKEDKLVNAEDSIRSTNEDKGPEVTCALVVSLEPEASDPLETYNTTIPEKPQWVGQTGIIGQESEDSSHDNVDKEAQMQEVEKTKSVSEPESSDTQCGQTSDFNTELSEEAVPEAEEVSTSVVCISEGNEVTGEAILTEDQDRVKDGETETQENKGDQQVAVRDASPEPKLEDSLSLVENKDNKVMEDTATVSYLLPEPSCHLNGEDNFLPEGEIVSTLILNKTEVNETEGEIKEKETKEEEERKAIEERKDWTDDGVKVITPESDKEIHKEVDVETAGLRNQEIPLSSMKTETSTSLTVSGFELSSGDPEDLPSPREVGVFLSPTKTICLRPVETTTLLNMTDQVFRPVEPEDKELEDEVHIKESNVSNKSSVSANVCQDSSEDADITVSKPETDTPTGPIRDTDMETAKSEGDESTKPKTTTVTETTSTDSDLPNTMKLESISSTQTILENDSQADETERNITPLITESFPGTEAKLKHETQFTPMTCSINTNVNADTTQGLVDTDKEDKLVNAEDFIRSTNEDKGPEVTCALVVSLEPEASDPLETYNTTIPEKPQWVGQTGIIGQESEDSSHDNVDKEAQMQEVEKTKSVSEPESSDTQCGQTSDFNTELSEEAVPEAEEVSTSAVCISEGNEVTGEAILTEDRDRVKDGETETQENKGDQQVAVRDASPEPKLEDSLSLVENKDNKVMEDTATVSYLLPEPSCHLNGEDNFLPEGEIVSTLILNKTEVNETEGEIKEKETKEEEEREEIEERKDWTDDGVKVITPESDKEIHKEVDVETAGLRNQEIPLSSMKAETSTSLTDSGFELSSGDPEDLPSPREVGVFLSPTKTICLRPVETTTLLNMTDQVFRPIEPEGNETPKVPSLDLCLSPNDSETCLSPVEVQDFQTLSDEEDEEVCQNLTEAKTTVSPVEKFVLLTKESSLSNQDVPEEDRGTKVVTEVNDTNESCFNANRSNNTVNLNDPNIDWRPTSSGSSNRVQEGLFGGTVASQEELASNKEHDRFSSLHRESVRKGVTATSLKDQHKDTGHPVLGKGLLSAGGSPESSYKNLSLRDRPGTVGNEVGGQRNNDWSVAKTAGNTEVFCKSGIFESVPASDTSSFGGMVSDAENKLTSADCTTGRGVADSKPNMAGNTTGIFSGMAANSAGTVSSNVKAAAATRLTGRVRHGDREWIIYSGSPGRLSSLSGGGTLPGTGNEETANSSVATHPAANPSPAPTGRSSGGGSGEQVTYSDRTGRTSCLASGFSLPSPEAATTTGLQGRIRYGSGEWNVYSSSPGRTSSLAGGLSSPSAGSKEQIQPFVGPPPAKRSPAAGRFGSGEWAVYGSSPGQSSCRTGGFSSSSAGSEEKVNAQVNTHQGKSAPAAGRFGSGEWAVYGRSPGQSSCRTGGFSSSSAGSEEKVNAQVNTQQGKSAPAAGRFGSGEWAVYGRSPGQSSCRTGGFSSSIAGSEEKVNAQVNTQQGKSAPAAGRFGSGGSGEWKVYSGSTGRVSSADRVSSSTSGNQISAAPSSHRSGSIGSGSGGRLGPISRSVVRRSSSVGSGGRLSSGGTHRISSSGTLVRTGSSEWKPVYSSANEQRNSAGSDGGSVGNQRAPSPGERMSVSGGSSGWLSTLTPSRKRVSPTSSSDRAAVRRISSASGSGRTTSTGGRVISSSDRPTRSTGSGSGAKKERISVCKMTALSMSAAGREKGYEGQSRVLRSQQQQEMVTTPLVQHWLTTSVGVTRNNPDGFDDVARP